MSTQAKEILRKRCSHLVYDGDPDEKELIACMQDYADLKTKELKERAEKLRLALVMAEFALRLSYDVTQWPADGSSEQDSAIKIANEALASWKEDQTNKNEG